ncbi:DUF6868 family protein [Solilutibacter pythonis]|uniref:DUF6868 family protein n=1 Tax=Solilutibacter pythonis TaxID=2483112 RepID=UPI001B861F5A|nr:hypothetical protein [Lysobacter pythonis]
MSELEILRRFLGLCVLGHYAVLLVWFGVFVFVGDGLYRLHARWFRLGREAFDALHYGGLAAYKIGVLLFFFVPWFALR